MPTFYKGAGIGTHWHTHDPQEEGFMARSPGTRPETEALIEHIVTSTVNSPYISLTRSYAVAWTYAVHRGRERPVPDCPAYVYQIEIDVSLIDGGYICDPVVEVSQTLPSRRDEFGDYQHNGLPDFLLEGVSKGSMRDFLVGWEPPPPAPGILCEVNITPLLEMLVYAIRDAEILVCGHIQPDLVTHRFNALESDLGNLLLRRNSDE